MAKSLTNQMAAVEKGVAAIVEIQPGGEEDENPFNRLSDELIISCIFDRISDVRYLFICSMVSRRFACLILQTQNISVIIPCISKSQTLSFPEKFRKFLSKPFSFLKQLLLPTKQLNKPCYDLDSKFLASMFIGFLANLSSTRNLKAEVSCPATEIEGFSIRWLLEIESANSGRLIVLFYKSLTSEDPSDTTEAENNSSRTEIDYYSEISIDDTVSIVSLMTTSGLLFYNLLSVFVPIFPNLKNAVISDSNTQGRLIVKEEKIIHMRAGDEALKDISANLKVWDEAVLKLPVSGFVMKNVRLAIVQPKLEGEVCHDELIEDENEEMGTFGEAVREMMKKDAVLEENLTREFSG